MGLFAVSMVSNLLMLTGPMFMLQIYDRVLASRSVPTLIVLTVLICALFGFYAFLETLRSRMAARFADVLDARISGRLFDASVHYRLSSGNARSSDPVRDSDQLRQFLSSPGPLSLLDLPWVPAYLGVVFILHVWLGWLAVAGGLVIVVLMICNEVVSRKPSSELTSHQQVRQRQSDDARNNAETVMAMGMLDTLRTRWTAQSRQMLSAQRRGGDRASLFSSLTKGSRLLLQSLVLALGAYLAIHGDISPGLMIAASIITARALAPVEQIVGQWRSFVGARQAWGRIRRVLDIKLPGERAVSLPLPTRSIAVRNLATAPAGLDGALVAGINFELHAGEGLGIIGASGCGKSSLVRAIMGVWPARAGEVRFDGAPLGHYRPDQVGRMIGYLPQRVDLFDGTIAENIARFRPDATSEKIIAAARLAGAHDLINALEDGYNSPVGEQGDRLSGGQKQRVGLARALYDNPFLIVLDEPNANLDSEGDAAMTHAIQQARARGAIVMVIAHRPSAIAGVEKVLYMQAGRQLAFGAKHDVLPQILEPAGNVRPMKAPGS
ncbi:MAG: type I secretion system permease/ATPase [Devosia sp.]|uniref:type I secretion system permease/ATPase n=1 Tax=Devosia sp. TaxID=1871048 RepID=UPI0024C7483D|nr:type I secretion system permease/ATPase [Devosia sp.]UYN99981.1 MAG: type I secretion system permease/ATPase [Devosia sp.]